MFNKKCKLKNKILRIKSINIVLYFVGIVFFSSGSGLGQETFTDKLYPRSEDWTVNCRISRITPKTVIVFFQNRETPVEVQRTYLKMIEYEDGRQIIFNQFGQIEGEITASRTVQVKEVLNPGLLRLENGEEIVLNGIDFSLPADSLELYYFYRGTEYVKSLIQNRTVQLQYDIQKRDAFGRQLVYVILPGGLILNTEIIKRGYSRLDRGRMLIYLEDFKLLEAEAKRENRGIWKKGN